MGLYTFPMGRVTWAKIFKPGQAQIFLPKTFQDPKTYKNIRGHMGACTFPMGRVTWAKIFEQSQAQNFSTKTFQKPNLDGNYGAHMGPYSGL